MSLRRTESGHPVQRNIVTMGVCDGAMLTWIQRICYATFGLFILAFGIAFAGFEVEQVRQGEWLGGIVWLAPACIFLGSGGGVIRNVLRFPVAEAKKL